jgi:hypothetical protein
MVAAGLPCDHSLFLPFWRTSNTPPRRTFTEAACKDHFHPCNECQGALLIRRNSLASVLEDTPLTLGTMTAPSKRYRAVGEMDRGVRVDS